MREITRIIEIPEIGDKVENTLLETTGKIIGIEYDECIIQWDDNDFYNQDDIIEEISIQGMYWNIEGFWEV